VQPASDEERRRYWTLQMDAAYRFMLAVQEYPVEECGEPVIPLREAASAAGVTVFFSELPHVRGLPRLFFLRRGLAAGFLDAAREMNGLGWALKVEDAFRTREMQKHNALRPEVFPLVLERTRWELGGRVPGVELLRRRLAALIAMNARVGTHCSGSAIDVSVICLDTGREVQRGAPYLEISEKTPMGSPFVPEEAAENRSAITSLMARHGFCTYPFEFWHYNAGDAYAGYLGRGPGAARYGAVDVDIATGAVSPIPEPTRPLNSAEELESLMQDALGRSGEGGQGGGT
jgi:zinc D-Ala-D-Ala dipeptidase